MALLNILIGGESFREIRERSCCYIDKTTLLEEFFRTTPPKVSLITRPRRFGKTLCLTMLQEFFDIQKDSRAIFEGLAVMRQVELCRTEMNRYPTLFLSFKDVEGRSYALACEKMANVLSEICIAHSYLFTSPVIDPDDKKRLQRIKSGEGSEKDLTNCLRLLCRVLQTHWGRPVILLIDEYDVPLNNAEQNDFYQEMIGFLRDLLGSALKTNPFLHFAILTGCIRLAKESIFTGLNNFMCYSISDTEFADKFGFTEDEVDGILYSAGLSEKKREVKEWYDGYRFGTNTEIYCPWDILTHVAKLQKNYQASPQTYWNNTSGNAIVKTLITQASQETQRKIEQLLAGQAIEETLSEELTYDLVYENENNLWSMLYSTGYLTKAQKQSNNGTTALILPNKEIRKIFMTTVAAWFQESLKKQDLSMLVAALWNGACAEIQTILTRILYETISYYDSAETFYHGFLAGILRGAGLVLQSNRESGLGRTDILIEDGQKKRALIIELKHAASYEQLRQQAENALSQIDQKAYAKGLPPQIQMILKYGIAFWKKECWVSIHRENGRSRAAIAPAH